MAVVSKTATLTLNTSGGSRTWSAVASVQDVAAGGSLTITMTAISSGATPPTPETTFTTTVFVDAAQVLVRSMVGTGTVTFYFTGDGLSSGSARAGTLRIRVRAQQTTGLAATQYDVTSDAGGYGSPAQVLPTGGSITQADQGWIRGTTTATATLNAASYAYGDTVTSTVTVGAVAYSTPATLSQTFGGLAASTGSSSTTSFSIGQGVVGNQYPAASGTKSTVTTAGLASLTSLPWTVFTTTTEASSTVDPRLTLTRLLQINDNVFGTPPAVKSVGTVRLTSDLGFFTARVVNASGAGVNGITYTSSLQDAAALVAAVTRTGVVTATNGGQAGWGTSFGSWPDGLPTGTWNHTITITAPSTATGLETPAASTFSLIAANPNLRLVCGGGPATTGTDARHFTPGVPLLAGVVVFNTATMVTITLDTSPTPAVALGRFSLTLGRAEFLDSDGVWKATNGASIYYWPCTVSAGDSKVWTYAFTDTSTWSVSDLFIIGRAYVGGVPVSSFQKEIAVAGINNHSGYAFDGAGFVGFPVK